MSKSREHKYNNLIDINNIESNPEVKCKYRYSLTLPLRNPINNNYILIIMMNPAKATKEKSDLTINKVTNKILQDKKFNFGKIEIANLYPMYEQDSSELKLNKKEAKENSEILFKLIEESDKVLIAWGKPYKIKEKELHDMEYHHLALKVIEELIKINKTTFILEELRDNLYPRHPRNIKDGYKLIPYDDQLENLATTLKNKITYNKNKHDAKM